MGPLQSIPCLVGIVLPSSVLWLLGSWDERDVVYARMLDGRGTLRVFQFVALEVGPTPVADIARVALTVGPRRIGRVPATIRAGQLSSCQAK